MIDFDKVYIEVVKPGVVWVKPLSYEVNIDNTEDIIEELLNEPMDPNTTYFGNYDEAKVRIELEIKLPQVLTKGKKRIEKIRQECSTLLLIEGKGDDMEEDDTKDEANESK